jgi:hypothetical protein
VFWLRLWVHEVSVLRRWDIRPTPMGDALYEAHVLEYDLVRQVKRDGGWFVLFFLADKDVSAVRSLKWLPEQGTCSTHDPSPQSSSCFPSCACSGQGADEP